MSCQTCCLKDLKPSRTLLLFQKRLWWESSCVRDKKDIGEFFTCQSIDTYQACRTCNTDQMSMVLVCHGRHKCFVCLKQRHNHKWKFIQNSGFKEKQDIQTKGVKKSRKYINPTQKWDIALTLSVFSTTASGVSMNLLPLTMPALFISMVTSPISLFT